MWNPSESYSLPGRNLIPRLARRPAATIGATSLAAATLLASAVASLPAAPAAAHGINGHVWVSDGAITRTTACFQEPFTHPEIRNALQFGAAFPDSGYASDDGRDYAETAHWESFIETYVRHLRTKYPAGLTSPAAWQDAAFLLGVGAHGLEDEVFDSIFMRMAEEFEGSNQDILDPGTDFMLIAEGHTDLKPDVWVPFRDVLDVYGQLDMDVSEKLIDRNTALIRTVVIGLVDAGETLDDDFRPQLPWTAEHFLDPQTPGSHAFERDWAVGRYLMAVAARIQGAPLPPELQLIGGVPARGARLWSNAATSAAARVTLIFGLGLDWSTVDGVAGAVSVTDAATGAAVAVTVANTRWGNAFPRLIQLIPHQDWAPGATYIVTLGSGVRFIDGSAPNGTLRYRIDTACDSNGPCPAVPPAPDEPEFPMACAPAKPQPVATAAGCSAGAAGQTWLLMTAIGFTWWLRRRAIS